MSLSPEKTMLLMALADGELEGDARAEAEALVASNDDARRLVEALCGPASEALGEWVAESQVERAVAAGADSLAGAVMARIASDATGSKGTSPRVVSLDAARARRDGRVKVAAGLVALVTLAAGVLFYVGSDKALQPVAPTVAMSGAPTAPANPVTVPMPSPSALASADPAMPDESLAPSAGPEVIIESSTSHDVTVFHIPASMGAAVNTPGSVVVWISDDRPQGK